MEVKSLGRLSQNISEHKPRSAILSEWETGNVTSVAFIHPSSSHKLVIDCGTHPINSVTMCHYGFEIHCERAILPPPRTTPPHSVSLSPRLTVSLPSPALLLQCASLRIQPSNTAHILLKYVSIKLPCPDCLSAPVSISSCIGLRRQDKLWQQTLLIWK